VVAEANYFLSAQDDGTILAFYCSSGTCLDATKCNSTDYVNTYGNGAAVSSCCAPDRRTGASNALCAECKPDHSQWGSSCVYW
jgi:hypothetical protein